MKKYGEIHHENVKANKLFSSHHQHVSNERKSVKVSIKLISYIADSTVFTALAKRLFKYAERERLSQLNVSFYL